LLSFVEQEKPRGPFTRSQKGLLSEGNGRAGWLQSGRGRGDLLLACPKIEAAGKTAQSAAAPDSLGDKKILSEGGREKVPKIAVFVRRRGNRGNMEIRRRKLPWLKGKGNRRVV